MRRMLTALALSVLAHLLLSAAIERGLRRTADPDASAELELSSVELSFAEEESETQSPAAMPDSAPPPPLKPEADSRPSESVQPVLRTPDPRQPDFPEPAAERSEMMPPPEAPAPPNPDQPPPPPAAAASTADRPAPRQARIEAPPRPLRTIRPEYPSGARQRREEGEVVLELEVDASGAVVSARVVSGSGFAELDAAALRAAKRARFRPARSDGKPVASIARLPVRFQMKR